MVLAKTFLLMICTNLFPSLLSWQSFHGYNATVLKCAFRILIPLNVIYDQAVDGHTATFWLGGDSSHL